MRRYIFTIMAVAAMIVSCNKESIETPYEEDNIEPITSIGINSEEATRAIVSSSDATKILWESNDEVDVYGSYSQRGKQYYSHNTYKLSEGAGSTHGVFTNSSTNIMTIKQVLYPASAGNFTVFNIPTVQTARKGSFDKNAAIMYCEGDPDGKTMKLAVNFLKVTVKEDEVVSAIKISSSQALTGGMSITSNGVEAGSGAVNYVKLTAGDGKTLSPGDYYIAVRACSIEEPVITYKFAHSIKSKAGSGAITFAEGKNVKPIRVDFSNGDVKGAVQLWANGPYWSIKNVGASSPEDPGYYFSWGNTTGYIYDSTIRKWRYSGEDGTVWDGGFSWSHYSNSSGSNIQRDLNPIASEDAAVAAWGSDWRMPTYEDVEGFTNNTTATFNANETYLKVTGKGDYAGDYIIIPSMGDGFNDLLVDYYVYLWTTKYYVDSNKNPKPYYIVATRQNPIPHLIANKVASYGMNIRPVMVNTNF